MVFAVKGVTRDDVDELRARARERAGLPADVQRFPMEIRFARELGWIEVRDPFTGQWHEIWSKHAPTGWVRAAYAEKQRRRAVSRQTLDAEAFAF